MLPNGAPLIALSSGSTHSYDGELNAWIKLSQPWWGKSDLWEGRRGGTGVAGRGIVRGIESAINDILVDGGGDGLSSEEEADDEHEYTGSSAAILNHPNKRRKKKSNPIGKTEIEIGNDQNFRAAITLGHLEAKMVMSVLMDSAVEYRAALTAYTKRLADEGLKSKAEELIRDLMGPIYL